MSDDLFKRINYEPPSLDFLEDVYKAQLIAMSSARPTIKAINDMNALALNYLHLFKTPSLQFTVPKVNLGIDLEKLNAAISRINEPLIKVTETVKSITAEQYRATLFSKDISEKIHDLTDIPIENIDYSIVRLRIKTHAFQSLRSTGSISAVNEVKVNQKFRESKHLKLPPIFKNHVTNFNTMILGASGIELLRSRDWFDEFFTSNMLLIFIVSYCLFLFVETKDNN